MSMRTHFDPIHDIDLSSTDTTPGPAQEQNSHSNANATPNKTRLNISNLLSNNDDLVSPGESLAASVPPVESDTTLETEDEKSAIIASNEIAESATPINNKIKKPHHSTKDTNQAPPSGTFATETPKRKSAANKGSKNIASKLEGALAKSKVPINKVSKKSESGKQKRTNQTLLIGAKQHHIKKKDGEPLWRRDIQYDFLSNVFNDEHKVFTNPYQPDISAPDHKITFSELYIRAIAHSPKTSKILKERLLSDRSMAVPVGMVSLLVNVGRMNTTINFVPEMKSQLRTYHSIPSLQHSKDQHNKILQDSPRLKSILKSCCEYREEPTNFQDLLQHIPEDRFPKASVVNIIFLLCSFEHLASQHFYSENLEQGKSKEFFTETPVKYTNLENMDLTNPDDCPFNCIFLNFETTPESRARRFLWFLYNYLETNLIKEEVANNPFGINQSTGVPPLEPIPEGMSVDVDTPEEIGYADKMLAQRRSFLFLDGTEQQSREKLPVLNNTKPQGAADSIDNQRAADGSVGAHANNNKLQEETNGKLDPSISEGTSLSNIMKGRQGKHTTNLKLTKADKKRLENGSSKIKEYKPKDIYDTIYTQNKLRHRKKRRVNGNVSFFNHLIKAKEIVEEEDIVYDSNGKPVVPASASGGAASVNGTGSAADKDKKSTDKQKKRYNGDFGEFSSTCVKMFKLATINYERKLASGSLHNSKVDVKVAQDGLKLTEFLIDVI